MALLRDYYAAIGEIIIKYSGTLERYAGDGVMVVFNDPVPVENPALQAVLMALELREAIGKLSQGQGSVVSVTTLVSGSVSLMASQRLALLGLRDGLTTPRSGPCRMSLLACAMKRSQGKSSSVHECLVGLKISCRSSRSASSS